jgi:hypothetical protein
MAHLRQVGMAAGVLHDLQTRSVSGGSLRCEARGRGHSWTVPRGSSVSWTTALVVVRERGASGSTPVHNADRVATERRSGRTPGVENGRRSALVSRQQRAAQRARMLTVAALVRVKVTFYPRHEGPRRSPGVRHRGAEQSNRGHARLKSSAELPLRQTSIFAVRGWNRV